MPVAIDSRPAVVYGGVLTIFGQRSHSSRQARQVTRVAPRVRAQRPAPWAEARDIY